MQLQSCVYGTKSSLHHLLVLLFCSLLAVQAWALGIDEVSLVQAQKVFNGVTRVGEIEKEIRVRPAFADDRILGYLFLTNEIAPIPAYSGKPVAVLIGMNLEAQILGVDILAHEEPILVVGVTDSDLAAYTNQYHHQFAFDKVKVGAHNREGYVGIDGISGATITAMVLNRSIMRSAQRVSSYYGLPVVVTQNSGVPPASLEVPAVNVKSTPPVPTKL
ncbi:MAG: FMN-binding protein, partial [Pseudomonadales bacterium]|nr:FMN-binding protein [Pseudomonadales bacterium]